MSVVHKLQTLIAHLQAKVIGGAIADASDLNRIAPFTAVAIDTAPKEQVDVEIALAEYGISLDLPVITCSDFRLYAVHVGTLLGDDIHHACQSHVAIE